jgi:DNA-binding beta-propeller fold protein YncE
VSGIHFDHARVGYLTVIESHAMQPTFAALFAIGLLTAGWAEGGTLELQAKILLPNCKGRIDHLAFDVDHRRLFVAELGNDTVAVVDVDRRRLEQRLEGLKEPQGLAYFASLHRLYVAEGGDGTVRAYDAASFRQVATTKLSGDADNVRIDPAASRVYVGYGDGALAVLDPGSLHTLGNIPLKEHPESFQLSPIDGRIYVNVPSAKEIAVLDRKAGRQLAFWTASEWAANYPMAIDEQSQSVLSVFRRPARLARYSMKDGTVSAQVEVCGDADDIFVDVKREHVYVICGEGVVDVLDRETLKLAEKFPTSPGARTGLYSPDADLLFVAARAEGGHDAAVWVLKPSD